MSKTLAAVLVLTVVAAKAPAQTVDEIVARHVEARGGAAAWRAVETVEYAGSMEVGKGMSVPFRLQLKRPHKARIEFDFAGSTAIQTYDGKQGWKLLPFRGQTEASPLTEAELAVAASQAEIEGPLMGYAAKGHSLELMGRETVEGRETYKLALTLRGGGTRWLYLDAASGLEAVVEAPHRLRTEEKRLRTHYRDYRRVGSVTIPHVLESRIEGAPYSHKLTITSVQLGRPIADARFARPTAAEPVPVRRSSR